MTYDRIPEHEGAMQFELNKTPRNIPGRPEIVFSPKPGSPEWIWVGPRIKNKTQCGCKFAFPVLLDYLPREIRKQAKKAAGGTVPVECECTGKVIE